MFVIVPNCLRDEINEKLDAAYKDCPEAEPEREHHFNFLVSYFNDHGNLPDFKLGKNPEKGS